MKEFNVTKRNRKYFAATTGGYSCKILIDDNSDALEIGYHTIDVEDISVRSKYGTDLIFRLAASASDQKSAGICTLRADYNENLVAACRKLGGKWDGDEMAWIFSGLVESEVEDLDAIYNSEMIAVELDFHDDVVGRCAPVSMFGIRLASATGRDSGASFESGISVIEGGADSQGSSKNWQTVIKQGTILRMYMPEALIKNTDDVTITRI